MDQQPKIPTLKDAQKPQVKVKGLGAGLTLFDRLKQFKKKDLAFILAGLGTLFMAPLAEHFMMAPEGGGNELEKGWAGGKGGAGNGIFGSGSSPYETGSNGGIAQGGAVGGAGDIITPLNVRDPSALVMGPGAAQQPPAGSAAPVTPPPAAPTKTETDYKDALAGAASRAASASVKKSPLPVPKVALGGTNMRGLGVASGGSSAGASLGPVGPAAGSTGSGGGSSLNLIKTAPNFRGVAGARGPASPTGLDGTKKAGQNAGDAFSRTGSALSGLNAAASEQIPTGGQGFGGGGQGGAGANDKGGGGSGPGGSKSVGESLAFIEAKERMMENLKLEFEKKKLKDPELLLYGIRNDSLKAMASELTKKLTEKSLGYLFPAPGADSYSCTGGMTAPSSFPMCGSGDKTPLSSNCWTDDGSGIKKFWPGGPTNGGQPAVTCTPGANKDPKGPGSTEQASRDANNGRISVPTGAYAGTLNNMCTGMAKADQDIVNKEMADSDPNVKRTAGLKNNDLKVAKQRVGNVSAVHDMLAGGGTPRATDCGASDATLTPITQPKAMSVRDSVEGMRASISGADGSSGLVKTLKDIVSKGDPSGLDAAKTTAANLSTQWDQTKKLLDDVDAALLANKDIGLDNFGNKGQAASSVAQRKTDFKHSVDDSMALAQTLRTSLNNLQPAVNGVVASASSLADPAEAKDGSVKLIVTTYKADVDLITKAQSTMLADKKTPVMTQADVVSPGVPDGQPAPAASGGVTATTPNPKAFDAPIKAAADSALAAKKILDPLSAKLDGDDDKAKGEVKTALTDASTKGAIQNLTDAKRRQNDVLDAIGKASNDATKPATNPATVTANPVTPAPVTPASTENIGD